MTGKKTRNNQAAFDTAEDLKNRGELALAKKLYEKALGQDPGNVFLKQRVVLMTYKLKQPNAMVALYKAQEMARLLKKKDPETWGLSGSIEKKLYEDNNDSSHIDKAIQYYANGYKKGDYYNGINLAYLYMLKASLHTDVNEAIGLAQKAQKVHTRVAAICEKLIDQDDFEHRNDKHYIYQTLAQAYLGLDKTLEVLKLIPTINEVSKGNFDLDVFHEQSKKLMQHMTNYTMKYRRYI